MRIYEKFLKRPIDFLLSFLAIIILCPVLIIVAILVRYKLGRPVIYKQKRLGLNERAFTLYKFRTMTNEKDETGMLLPDLQRLTKFGRILRLTSVDEFPGLFNILLGDMSIVGPRPLIDVYLDYYTEKERHRHDVRPGLTGLAQINGRSFISWEEIFRYDLKYINNITFIQDIKIIWKTIINVMSRKNVVDLSQAITRADGKLSLSVDDEDLVLHGPLNIERAGKKSCKEK